MTRFIKYALFLDIKYGIPPPPRCSAYCPPRAPWRCASTTTARLKQLIAVLDIYLRLASGLLLAEYLRGPEAPAIEAKMREIGAALGSDVPFFLQSKGTTLATGRGERIEPSVPAPPGWVIISVPDVKRPEPKTALMYEKVEPTLFTDGEMTDRWGHVLGGGTTSWSALTHEVGFTNVFEPIAVEAYPDWEAALETFQTVARGTAVSMTGTGPALFAVFDDHHEAGKTLWALNAARLPSVLTEIANEPLKLM